MDDRESMLIEQEMREDHLVLIRAPHLRAALAQLHEVAPDLVIVNVDDESARDVLLQLRAEVPTPTPVLVVTDEIDAVMGLIGENGASTDLLAKPFSPSMLRTRVRAWLGRTLTDAARAPLAESLLIPVGRPDT